jgi:Fe-Mn family superoxide dismutase
MYEPQPLPHGTSLIGTSEKAHTIHHDKLYVGYVNKRNEIVEKLAAADLPSANATYSELRSLKAEETFAANGTILHEVYFDVVGEPNGEAPQLRARLAQDYSSFEQWKKIFTACGMASRGWVVLAWDTNERKLAVYTGDAHNQGGVWGCIPIIALDVYEHAYFIDFGSDRKAYLEAFWQNLNWPAAERRFKGAVNSL